MRLGCLLLFPLILAPICQAHAELVYNYEAPFSNADETKPLPGGDPPWLRATFTNLSDTSALLRLDGVYLPDEQFVSGFYFNFKPDLSPSSLAIVHESGLEAVTVATGKDAFKADGDGHYDILFSFETSNASEDRFVHGSCSQYIITYDGDLPSGTDFAKLFDYPAKPGGGFGPYYTAAHIQNIPHLPGDEDSTWVYGETPEPGGMVVWIVLAALAMIERRKRQE